MIIKNISLLNFRNYKELNDSFYERFNVIYGYNGQGKTNILESIFLCATGKSHRTSHDIEMIKTDEDQFNVKLDIESSLGERNIDFSYNKLKQKVIKINDICLKKIGNLLGNLNVVIFSPEDLLIVKQGPSLRRRFIDISLSQIRRSYFFKLQQYNKVLLQRNALLKQIKRERYNNDISGVLDVWNDSLARSGADIIFQRRNFLSSLSKMIAENHSFISQHKEELSLKYKCSVHNEECNLSAEELYDIFHEKLKSSVKADIERESTSYGPHRDDFIYMINNMDLKLYGSQGQQRTAVLSTKLAELEIMMNETGEAPVLLLDDVMSELDNDRQEFLFDKLSNIQTFITCTDKNIVKNRLKTNAAYFYVFNGKIASKEI